MRPLPIQAASIWHSSGVRDGLAWATTAHTSAGLLVTEGIECLERDVLAHLERLAPKQPSEGTYGYWHNRYLDFDGPARFQRGGPSEEYIERRELPLPCGEREDGVREPVEGVLETTHQTNMRKQDTRFKIGASGSEAAKWKPGQSGNPAGTSKRRVQFEEAFNEALLTEGGPEEAAKLLWEAARGKEAWAIPELCRRFAPQMQSLQVLHEVHDDKFDYSKLTDEQLQQLDAILEKAGAQPLSLECGESATKPA